MQQVAFFIVRQGARMQVTRWVLYVDESGAIPFVRHKRKKWRPDECNVTGVLVDKDRGDMVSKSLQKQYQTLYPWVSWPFHHSEFKQPLHHVAWLSAYVTTHNTGEELSIQPRKTRQWPYTQAQQMVIASRALELTWGL